MAFLWSRRQVLCICSLAAQVLHLPARKMPGKGQYWLYREGLAPEYMASSAPKTSPPPAPSLPHDWRVDDKLCPFFTSGQGCRTPGGIEVKLRKRRPGGCSRCSLARSKAQSKASPRPRRIKKQQQAARKRQKVQDRSFGDRAGYGGGMCCSRVEPAALNPHTLPPSVRAPVPSIPITCRLSLVAHCSCPHPCGRVRGSRGRGGGGG